jgi:1-acyl-sn-glycerol-3-phosphate acyltransferase
MKNLSLEIEQNNKIVYEPKNFNTQSRFLGKLRYLRGMSAAAAMFIFVALPVMVIAKIFNRPAMLYPWCDWGAKTWLWACGAKVKVHGKENLDDKKSYIFVANHRSYLDTATMFSFTGRRMGFVAKKELAKVPIVGWVMPFVNILAIDRSNSVKALATMNAIKEVFDKDISIGIFAEGTRAKPHELLPFKKGAFHLALQTQAAVVPVAIKNTDIMMGKKKGVAYAGTIEVVFLKPIETKDLSVESDLMNLLNKTRQAIAEELGKAE